MSSLIRGNLLTQDLQSVEGASTGWASSVNCSVAVSATQAFDGVQSLAVTATAAGTVKFLTPQISLPRGAALYAEMWTRASAATTASLFFFDLYNNGSFVTTPTSPSVTNTSSGWTVLTWFLNLSVATNSQVTHFTYGIQNTATGAAEVQFYDRLLVRMQRVPGRIPVVGGGVVW